jgi:hypothetical protein
MSRRSQDNSSTSKTGWEMAVEDAKKMVKNAQSELAEAQAVLAICVDRRDKGEPFPGDVSSETDIAA